MSETEQAQIDILEQELRDRDQQKGTDIQSQVAGTIFNQNQDSNLIVFQLELDNILERIEHLLRGDVLVSDADENVKYESPEDTDLIVLNDYGVKLIMNVISFYLNRNTILSHHKESRIFEILHVIGHELADLIYESYEKMGLDTDYKRARYTMVVMNILHTIENAYNRSLLGGERDSLRSARVVTQSQPLGEQGSYAMRRKPGIMDRIKNFSV